MYNDKDLEEYDTYLRLVKARIQELNRRVGEPMILISQIEIDQIKDPLNLSGVPGQSDWEFYYHIDIHNKHWKKINDTIKGWIRYTNFHQWRLEKTQTAREIKLQQLGL